MPLAITVYVISNRIIFFERLAVFCKIFYTSCPSATSAILHLFLQQFIFTSYPLFDTLFRSQEFRRILKQVFIYWVGNQVIANFFGIVWILLLDDNCKRHFTSKHTLCLYEYNINIGEEIRSCRCCFPVDALLSKSETYFRVSTAIRRVIDSGYLIPGFRSHKLTT